MTLCSDMHVVRSDRRVTYCIHQKSSISTLPLWHARKPVVYQTLLDRFTAISRFQEESGLGVEVRCIACDLICIKRRAMRDLYVTPLRCSVFDHPHRCFLEGDQGGNKKEICVGGVRAVSRKMAGAVARSEALLPGCSKYHSVM